MSRRSNRAPGADVVRVRHGEEQRSFTILMFPERKYPCDHAMLESVYTLALPRRGHEVIWVMEQSTGASEQTATWNGTAVHLLPRSSKRISLLASAGRIWRAVRTALRIASHARIDIVQVRNELVGVCAALVLRARLGIPFVYQLSFPLVKPELLDPEAPASALRLRRLVTSVKRAVRWRVLQTADLVLAISDQMRVELVQQGLAPEKVVSFPLGVDAGIQPGTEQRIQMRAELGLGDAPTLVYFGAMDRLRRLDFLLDVMGRVLADMPTAILLMLGTASEERELLWLKDQSRLRGLDASVRFLGSVARADVPRYLTAAHLSVAPIPPLPTYIVSSPTKVVESLGLAIPVVANTEIPDQRMVITESGGGTCVPYETEAFAHAIVAYLKDPQKARATGQCGREYVLRTRSYSVLTDDIEALYEKLLADSGDDGVMPGGRHRRKDK